MKTLPTEIEITYDKKGNIKTLYSPYCNEEKNNTATPTLLTLLVSKIKKHIQDGI